MRRWQVILIIVSVLIILSIGGVFIYKVLNVENEDWLYGSGDEGYEEMIFKDVSKKYWAREYILYLNEREIMFGSGDGFFYPDGRVTYGEFVEILLRACMGKLDIDSMSGDGMLKVLEDNKIFENGEIVIEDFDKYITKAEVAIMLAKSDMEIRNYSQVITSLNYSDLSEFDEIDKTLIAHSIGRGFFEVNDEDKFYPNAVVSRAKMAEIVYLFLNK